MCIGLRGGDQLKGGANGLGYTGPGCFLGLLKQSARKFDGDFACRFHGSRIPYQTPVSNMGFRAFGMSRCGVWELVASVNKAVAEK